MKLLLNPRSILFSNTLPVLFLSFIAIGQYRIINSILPDESLLAWRYFTIGLTLLALVHLGAFVYLHRKGTLISLGFALLSLVMCITFIYLFGYHYSTLIPIEVPRWMLSGEHLFYVGTFLMPSMLHALLAAVVIFTPDGKKHNAGVNFGFGIVVPLVFYLLFQLIVPLWQWSNEDLAIHILVIISIVGTVAFLFFIVRGVYAMLTGLKAEERPFFVLLKLCVLLLFPLVGLLLNNGYVFTELNQLFGDFSNPWFYILTIVNGLFLLTPQMVRPHFRRILFALRALTLPFTFYFFIAFLPYIPLSVVLILAFGLGLFMLMPMLLWFFHVQVLVNDWKYLKSHDSAFTRWGLLVIPAMLIPMVIAINFYSQRITLHQALEYVYTPDYSKQYQINVNNLDKVLNLVDQHSNSRSSWPDKQIPYISSFYNWMVLDNLTLSTSRSTELRKIFFDYDRGVNFETEQRPPKVVELRKVEVESEYNEKADYWVSDIHMELTNTLHLNMQEYRSDFELPTGAFITDYYLVVGDSKEKGLMVDKRAALWVYNRIVNVRQDPGIIYFNRENGLTLRVFPFGSNETRMTGFQVIHKEPLRFLLDGHEVRLGNELPTNHLKQAKITDMRYIGREEKAQLPLVSRNPYFHFLIDCSEGSREETSSNVELIEEFLSQSTITSSQMKVSLVNATVKDIDPRDDWKEAYKNHVFEGGFFLERAIRKILVNNHQETPFSHPVMVVISNRFDQAILPKNFRDLDFTLPDTDYFFHLNKSGKISAHSLWNNSRKNITKKVLYSKKVRAYPTAENASAYFSDNHEPSLLINPIVHKAMDGTGNLNKWQDCVNIYSLQQRYYLNPATVNPYDIVKCSMQTGVLTPWTSYMVVETEAQRQMLLKKQKEVLSGNPALDLNDTQRMSEPGYWLVLLVLLFFLLRIKSANNFNIYNNGYLKSKPRSASQ
jgi:hypothetical protein